MCLSHYKMLIKIPIIPYIILILLAFRYMFKEIVQSDFDDEQTFQNKIIFKNSTYTIVRVNERQPCIRNCLQLKNCATNILNSFLRNIRSRIVLYAHIVFGK